MQTKTKRLTESAMLIAIAVVLELMGKMLIPPMPFGGQLTLCAMLPIVLISTATVSNGAWSQALLMVWYRWLWAQEPSPPLSSPAISVTVPWWAGH